MGGLEGHSSLTFRDPIHVHLVIIQLLCMGAQRNFRVSEEVFSDLSLPVPAQILIIPIYTSSRSV